MSHNLLTQILVRVHESYWISWSARSWKINDISQLIYPNRYYGGTQEDAVRRLFLGKAGLKIRLSYRVTPSIIRRFFEDAFIEYRFGHSALEDFICDHPNFIGALSVSMDSVSYEPEKVFSFCRRSAERYQLGISTVSERETLCLDESFAQRAFAILWREPGEAFSLEGYFNSVPTPELVVHVGAPVDLCALTQYMGACPIAVYTR